MQAASKDITDTLQRMARKEVQYATQMKTLQDMYQMERKENNARKASTTGHIGGTQALDRKEMPLYWVGAENSKPKKVHIYIHFNNSSLNIFVLTKIHRKGKHR